MKRLLVVVASVTALSAWGQTSMGRALNGPANDSSSRETISNLPDRSDLESVVEGQNGCPLHIVRASFERPAELMLTGEANRLLGPMLGLHYLSFAEQGIDSIELTVWIKVKDSPYQLDSMSSPRSLELFGEAGGGENAEVALSLRLPSNAIGLDRIELARVTFSDGTTWKARAHRDCVYRYSGSTERAEAR